jgi:hypothetical protein
LRRKSEKSNPGSVPDWEQAKLALQETGGWIKNADTKTTILAGAFGVSLSLAIPRLVTDGHAIVGLTVGFTAWVLVCVVLLGTVLAIGKNLHDALIPQTPTGPSSRNYLAWPDLAVMPYADVPPQLSQEEIRQQSWEQAITLAQIAKNKYTNFKRALQIFSAYLLLLLGLLILGATLS